MQLIGHHGTGIHQLPNQQFCRKKGVDKSQIHLRQKLSAKNWQKVSASQSIYRVPVEIKVTVRRICTLWVHGDCSTDLDPSSTMGLRAMTPALWWGAVCCRAAHSCWRALLCFLVLTSSQGHRLRFHPTWIILLWSYYSSPHTELYICLCWICHFGPFFQPC